MEKFEYKDGDILMVHVKKYSVWYRWLFGSLIKLFDGVYYHHCQIFMDGKLYEADTQVRIRETSENSDDEVIVFRPNVPLGYQEKNLMLAFLNKEVGRPYDYYGAIFCQLFYILTFRRIWIGVTGKKSQRTPYCTELVSGAWNLVRGYFPRPWLTSPYVMQQELPNYFTCTQIIKPKQ